MDPKSLPIWEIEPDITSELKRLNRLVIVAPTGSGKSTQVPQMVLDTGMAGEVDERGAGKRIIVLQPRRVAARTLAQRVAWERKCPLGKEVGYQVRFEDETSLGTRICFVTEGILLRWLQDDPELKNVAAILFDEFHERNLMSDVALALVKNLQQDRRPDLKLVVMSATLEAEPVAKYLNDCPILRSEGMSYPVEVVYSVHANRDSHIDRAADTVGDIVNSGEPGDILVFMPGMGDIMSTINAISHQRMREEVSTIPLHGELSPEDQDRAFRDSDVRKVVVATNVAETSVTIDGVRFVVDAGLARVARFDSEKGINTLLIEEISRASADQRKGRAGRTATGTCYRLWSESNHLNRPERNTPEIQRSDLAEVVLLLHSLGIRKASTFDWLDKPDREAIERAEELLRVLGALSLGDASGSDLTPIGRRMMRLPMHPRYSRMLIEAAKYDCVQPAALCAALVSGRDLFTRIPRGDKNQKEERESLTEGAKSDFQALIRAFIFARNNNFAMGPCKRMGIHTQVARQVDQTYGQILDILKRHKLEAKETSNIDKDEALRRAITCGFIDQLAMRRDHGTLECILTQGRTGTLMRESVLGQEDGPELFVIADIRKVGSNLRDNLTLLGLATAVEREWLQEMFPDFLVTESRHIYDKKHRRVEVFGITRFLDLVLEEKQTHDFDEVECGRALAIAAREGHFELPNYNNEIKRLIGRANLVAEALPELEFPAFDEAAILQCLTEAFEDMALAKEAQAAELVKFFKGRLEKAQLEWLDELTPTSIPWPDGKNRKLIYLEEPHDKKGNLLGPEIQVKLHECFQVEEHPVICEGQVPVRFRLQKPDGKNIAETTDWPTFRKKEYPKLKKELAAKFKAIVWV